MVPVVVLGMEALDALKLRIGLRSGVSLHTCLCSTCRDSAPRSCRRRGGRWRCELHVARCAVYPVPHARREQCGVAAAATLPAATSPHVDWLQRGAGHRVRLPHCGACAVAQGGAGCASGRLPSGTAIQLSPSTVVAGFRSDASTADPDSGYSAEPAWRQGQPLVAGVPSVVHTWARACTHAPAVRRYGRKPARTGVHDARACCMTYAVPSAQRRHARRAAVPPAAAAHVWRRQWVRATYSAAPVAQDAAYDTQRAPNGMHALNSARPCNRHTTWVRSRTAPAGCSTYRAGAMPVPCRASAMPG